MPIDRTLFNLWVNDDGSNTVGTMINKARIADDLLDPIDTAIAAAGGSAGPTIQTDTGVGTVNDFAVTAARHLILRVNNASLRTYNGFVAGQNGDTIDVVSVGAGVVSFAHQNIGSTAANRLINFATSAATSLAAGIGTARFIYDTATARWRIVDHEQGAWITPAYASGNYTATSGTVTVDAGDVARNAYYLKGRSLHWQLQLNTFSYSTPSYGVVVTLPAGFSAAQTLSAFFTYRAGSNSTTTVVGRADLGTTALTFRPDQAEGAANGWTASTDTSYIRFSDVIEVS